MIRGTLWSDYKETGNGITENYERCFAPGDEAVFYNEDAVELFFSTVNGKSFLESLYSPKYCLSYLIRGHQIFGAAFWQSPNSTVTTVFSALNGQEPFTKRQGAGVAVLSPLAFQPIPYIVLPCD